MRMVDLDGHLKLSVLSIYTDCLIVWRTVESYILKTY